MTETLEMFAKDGAYYKRVGVTNVRRSDTELRWNTFKGTKDSMALCFLAEYTHSVIIEGDK